MQAAQRAAKKQKTLHSAPQGLSSNRDHTAEPDDSPIKATHAQQDAQSALATATEASAKGSQQNTPARAASGTAPPAVHRQLANIQDAARRHSALGIAATDALIEALDPHDQPLVAYINRSSVPRILRQVACSSLLCMHA